MACFGSHDMIRAIHLFCICVCTHECRLKLKAFKKFQDTEEALAATAALIEGTSIDKSLKSFLKKVTPL